MPKLNPVKPQSSSDEPSYPSRAELHRSPYWKTVAAAISASALLWIPGCGENIFPVRTSGEMPPVQRVDPNTIQPPGTPPAPVISTEKPDPPENYPAVNPQVKPPQVTRTAGTPQPVRMSGAAPAPRP